MGKIQITLINFIEPWESLSVALKDDPSYEIKYLDVSPKETLLELQLLGSGLIIYSLMNKNDLVEIAKFYKSVKELQLNFKITPLDQLKFPQIENVLLKIGIKESLETDIKPKALKYKLDLWAKSLGKNLKNSDVENNNLTNKEVLSKQNNIDLPKANIINWTPSEEFSDDIWFAQNKSDCKKILNKWMIKLTGPSPFVCYWDEYNGESNKWILKFKLNQDIKFTPEGGNWFFKGEQKPEFIWKEMIWLYTGTQIQLTYTNGDLNLSKFDLTPEKSLFLNNSKIIENKIAIIKESFDQEIVLRNSHLQSKIQGQGNTDKLENKNLSGKTHETAHKYKDLSGNNIYAPEINSHYQNQSNFKENNNTSEMELKFKPADVSAPLEQEHQTEKIKTYWGNSNRYEENKNKAQFGLKLAQENTDQKTQVANHFYRSPQMEISLCLGPQKISCSIEDQFDDTLVLTTNEKIPSKDDEFQFQCLYQYKELSESVSWKTKIIELIEDEKEKIINIFIPENAKESFLKIIKLYDERQNDVDQFMKSARGY